MQTGRAEEDSCVCIYIGEEESQFQRDRRYFCFSDKIHTPLFYLFACHVIYMYYITYYIVLFSFQMLLLDNRNSEFRAEQIQIQTENSESEQQNSLLVFFFSVFLTVV